MRWSDVRILYGRELRSALRERAIVVNSILLPIFLYPLMLWLMFSGMMFVEGLASREDLRIAVFSLPAAHTAIRDSLAAADQVVLIDDIPTVDEAMVRMRDGDLEAAVEFLPAVGTSAGLAENFRARILYDRSEGRSARAQAAVERVVRGYREAWLIEEAVRMGAAPAELAQFRVDRENVASESEMGALLLGTMIPLFLVIMVAVGCFYPAIDSTAGERERSTWETLMTVSASRGSIIAAKYLYVATLGIAAGVLNVAALTASLGAIIGPLMGGGGVAFSFRFPIAAVPVMMLGAISLALFFAAAMMILASFARTFKDGQAMIAPVYWLAMIPLILGQAPDQRLDLRLALIPIANMSQMIKDAIQGIFEWPLIAVAVAEMLILVALCLWLARRILQFEDHLMGSFDGSFWKFARGRLLPGRARSAT